MTRRLEIGPGEHPLPGFDRLDAVQRPGVTYLARWGDERLPIDDAAYDEVYLSHVLEHVPWHRTHAALREIFRVLRFGGLIEVWVPDFAYVVECYLMRRCGDAWRRENADGHFMRWVNGRLFTYGPGDENWHRACFDESWLRQCLEAAGFINVTRIEQRTRGTSHGRIDLGMTGRKP